jgi:chitin disaccharide deacetylase
MSLSTLIINADDFGLSSIVNRAILASMEEGLVTSTSMMANMPGFEHGVGLARVHSKLAGRIGVHLNLTEGRPLSEPILDCPLFCANGAFSYRRTPLFYLSKKVREAVYLEFKTQVDRMLDAGIRPIHLDSHHHIHTEWALAPLVRRLGGEYKIPRIRLTRNIGAAPSVPKRLYKLVFNRWRLTGFRNTDYFGDIADLAVFPRGLRRPGKSFEIMVHPLFDEEGGLVDLDNRPLQPLLERILCQPINLYPKLTY